MEVINGTSLDGLDLKSHNIYETIVNYPFANTYYLTVIQESLTEEAYNYWSQVASLTKRDGNRFKSVPGVISTNIKNITNQDEDIFGYFFATEQDTMRIRVCPEDLINRPNSICFDNEANFTLSPSNNIPFCWCIYNHTSEIKPDYWQECD